MPAQNWYDVNEGRSYPFAGDVTIGGVPLPKTAVLDVEISVLAGAGLSAAVARLIGITNFSGDAPAITITIGVGAPLDDSYRYYLRFEVPTDSPRGAVHYADLSDDLGPNVELGSGFLVTGDLSDLMAAVPPGEAASNAVFLEAPALEPAQVHVDPYSGVFSLNLAVEPGLEPEVCGESLTSSAPADPVVVARDLHGALYVQGGYNTRLGVVGQRLEFTAELGAGDGVPAAEVTRVPQESSSQPDCLCDDMVYTINGIPPDSNGDFKISGGPGVALVAGTDSLAIVLNESALFKRCAP